MFMLIAGAAFLGSFFVRTWLKRTYEKWRRVPNAVQASGAQIAQAILNANRLGNVRLEPTKGVLTDHYIPSQDLVRLSVPVYQEPSVASLAVAAHEVGHAIQDARSYFPLKLKAALMPLAAGGSRLGMLMLIGGALMASEAIIQYGALLFLGAMLLPLLTLPIEFDASRRALNQLTELRLVDEKDYQGAKAMLTAAAMTYVAGAATSVALVGFLFLQLFHNRR